MSLLVQVNSMTELVKRAGWVFHKNYIIVIFIDDLDRVNADKVSLLST